MENTGHQQVNADFESKKAVDEFDKIIRERMAIATGCDELRRIVDDIMIPEFLDITLAMRKAGYAAEVVSYDAQHPIYESEVIDVGVKFRCGSETAPCKFEYLGDPEKYEFNLTIRDPNGIESKQTVPFRKLIPRNIRRIMSEFLDEHFPSSGYVPKFNDFDQYEDAGDGPFHIQMNDNGEISHIATTDTMEEAIKMGGTFTSLFKGKELCIVDSNGLEIC